jgi:glycosyltransferase involved in cell wall biosynthesis
VLLHCADREPWGLVLLEALATGRNVVAPAAGGPREIVTPGAGRLYTPGDATAGAAALLAQLKNLEPSAARRRAEAFPVEASAARFAEAIA